MASDHFRLPLCNNDKRYHSGKDLPYYNFPSDKQKRKRMPSLVYTQVHCFCPSSLVSNPKWQLRDSTGLVLVCHFSRTLRKLRITFRNSDWFTAPFAPVVSGRSNYFGIGFSTDTWKPLYYSNTHWMQKYDDFACEGSLLFAYNKSLNNNYNNNYIIQLKIIDDFMFH